MRDAKISVTIIFSIVGIILCLIYGAATLTYMFNLNSMVGFLVLMAVMYAVIMITITICERIHPKKVYKLGQISEELEKRLKSVTMDNDIAELGFECKGQLCEYEEYSEFYERLWIWRKVEGDKVYTAVTVDHGNTYCSVVYMNMFLEKLTEV